MTNLINLMELNFRKSRLSFGVLLLAILSSVPLSMVLKAKAMPLSDAVGLALIFWAIVGIPLSALALSAISGAEAASESARNIEQVLPVSQGKFLSAALIVLLLQMAGLLLAAYATMGFTLPTEKLDPVAMQAYQFYLYAAASLTIYGFTVSYALRNAVAGAALSAGAVLVTVYTLGTMSILENLTYEIVSLTPLKLAVAALVLAGVAGSLKLLSGVYARRERLAAVKLTAAALLLASPVLASVTGLALMNYRARRVTAPLSSYSFLNFRERETGEFMLAQQPFTGRLIVVDADGDRAVIEPEIPGGTRFGGLFQEPNFSEGEILPVPGGGAWILYSKFRKEHKLLCGSVKGGFVQRAAINDAWQVTLVGGEKPGVIKSLDGKIFYATLTPGKGELKWEKIPAKSPEEVQAFVTRKEAGAAGTARFSADGRTLIYKDRRWPVPWAVGTKSPLAGLKLDDGLNFIVPARSSTYLCRPDGRTETLWPEYFRLGQNFYLTPDGTAWGTTLSHSRITEFSLLGRSLYDFDEPVFYILTREGKALSGLQIHSALKKAGEKNGRAGLLKAEGDTLWFNVGDKYLVRVSAADTDDFKSWKLPASVWEGNHSLSPSNVSASRRGIFIAAEDGVYFMDWEGKLKKLV